MLNNPIFLASSAPPFLQRCKPTPYQPFLVTQILVALNHFCGSSLHFLQFFHILFQIRTPYLDSNCGLTSDLYNLSIVSLYLCTPVHNHSQVSFFLTHFQHLTSHISYDNSWFPFPICITEHFSRLNCSCQSCAHLNILLRSSRSRLYPLPDHPPLLCIALCHLQT